MSEAQRIATQLDKIYDSDMTNRLVAALSSPLYTIAEIEQLAKEWTKTQELTSNDRWLISHLFAWLKRREKEEGGR